MEGTSDQYNGWNRPKNRKHTMTREHSIWRIIIYNNGITLTTSINLLYYCWKHIYRRNSNEPLQEEKYMQATHNYSHSR